MPFALFVRISELSTDYSVRFSLGGWGGLRHGLHVLLVVSKGGCTIKSSSTTTASPKAGLGLGLGRDSFKYHGVCWCLTMYAILSGYREVCLYNTRQDIQHDCALVCLETSSPLKITPNTYSVQLNPGSSLPPPPPKKRKDSLDSRLPNPPRTTTNWPHHPPLSTSPPSSVPASQGYLSCCAQVSTGDDKGECGAVQCGCFGGGGDWQGKGLNEEIAANATTTTTTSSTIWIRTR